MRGPEARVAHVRFAGPAREARGARRGDDGCGCGGGRCGGGVGVGVGVVRAAPGGRVGVSDGRGDGEGLRWPVCGHMERVLMLRLLLRSLRLLVLLLLLLGRIRIHRPARARARRRRRVYTTRRHRHRGCVRVWRSKRKRRTGSLESDALHRETSVSGLLRTESIDISRVRAAPRPRPRGGGAGVDRRGRRAGGVERAGAECLVGGVRIVVGVLLSWHACWRWVVPLLLLLLRAVRAASVARRQRLRLHFFSSSRVGFFLHLLTCALVLFRCAVEAKMR